MLSIFSEHYETTYQLWEKNYKEHKMWRLNNMLLNNQWITEEIKEEIKLPRDKWKWKYDSSKPMWHNKSSSKKEVYSNINLPLEIRKTSKNKVTLCLKELEKETRPS